MPPRPSLTMNTVESVITQTKGIRQKTSDYLRSVEDRAYGRLQESFQWQERELSKLDESPTRAKLLVDSKAFGVAIFCCIAFHALLSALDVNHRAGLRVQGLEQTGVFESMQVVFLFIYIIEASLR